jgi:hypothetical protein
MDRRIEEVGFWHVFSVAVSCICARAGLACELCLEIPLSLRWEITKSNEFS